MDSVGRRIKEAGDKLLRLEKDIPALVEEWSKRNKTQLERSTGKLLDEMGDKLREIDEAAKDIPSLLD